MHPLIFTNKLFIINFEDSFTYNIASVLYSSFPNLTVIDHYVFFQDTFQAIIKSRNEKLVIILGPGPGHPKDYEVYFSRIEKMMRKSDLFIMGICLGHQIIASIKGYLVERSFSPVHGEQEVIQFNSKVFKVQRYNSLVPYSQGKPDEALVVQDQVYIFENNRLISYQFHPESIGTDDPFYFFQVIVQFCSVKNVKKFD